MTTTPQDDTALNTVIPIGTRVRVAVDATVCVFGEDYLIDYYYDIPPGPWQGVVREVPDDKGDYRIHIDTGENIWANERFVTSLDDTPLDKTPLDEGEPAPVVSRAEALAMARAIAALLGELEPTEDRHSGEEVNQALADTHVLEEEHAEPEPLSSRIRRGLSHLVKRSSRC